MPRDCKKPDMGMPKLKGIKLPLQLRPVNSPSIDTKIESSMLASIKGSFSAKFLLVISILLKRVSFGVRFKIDLIHDVK